MKLISEADVALKLIHVGTNTRVRFDEGAMEDLVCSIRQHGIVQPLILRQNGKGTYHLVGGERRLRAAQTLKLKSVPARLYEMSDLEAMEVQTIENLQREGLSPVEEARGLARLQLAGLDNDAMAQRLGKSRSWVFERLRLLTLAEPVLEKVAAGELSASVGGLLAQVPPALQVEAMENHAFNSWEDSALSFRAVKSSLEGVYTRDLRKAGFAQAAEPNCQTCPKRAGNVPESGTRPDVCMDPQCFAAKVAAHLEAERARLKAAGVPVLKPGYQNVHPKDACTAIDAPGKRTWKQALGAAVQWGVELDPNTGAATAALTEKAALAALKAGGAKLQSWADPKAKPDRDPRAAKLRDRNDRILAKLPRPGADEALRWLIQEILICDVDDDRLRHVFPPESVDGSALPATDSETAWMEWSEGLRASELPLWAIRLLLSSHFTTHSAVERISAALGMDLQAITKEVQAQAKAKAPKKKKGGQ